MFLTLSQVSANGKWLTSNAVKQSRSVNSHPLGIAGINHTTVVEMEYNTLKKELPDLMAAIRRGGLSSPATAFLF